MNDDFNDDLFELDIRVSTQPSSQKESPAQESGSDCTVCGSCQSVCSVCASYCGTCGGASCNSVCVTNCHAC